MCVKLETKCNSKLRCVWVYVKFMRMRKLMCASFDIDKVWVCEARNK